MNSSYLFECVYVLYTMKFFLTTKFLTHFTLFSVTVCNMELVFTSIVELLDEV